LTGNTQARADFICRTRCIDARLNDELERAFDRIIVFGAGYAIRLGRDWTSSPGSSKSIIRQRSGESGQSRTSSSVRICGHGVGRNSLQHDTRQVPRHRQRSRRQARAANVKAVPRAPAFHHRSEPAIRADSLTLVPFHACWLGESRPNARQAA